MKTIRCSWLKAMALLLFFLLVPAIHATVPGTPVGNPWLDYWSFSNTNTWASDYGFAPVSYTNLGVSYLGDGTAVVINSTSPAWLQYNITETNGTNNLRVDNGSVMFWFAPNWSSADTNQNGTGPGADGGRLIDVGSYTTNASNGWWSIYLDAGGTNIYFSAQTNNGSGATFLSAPISWATNDWHNIVVTYSATNSFLYIDGFLATNGSGVTILPPPQALTNGFFVGSASNGVAMAQGIFDDLSTYNFELNSDTVLAAFVQSEIYYLLNPLNQANILQGPSTPAVAPTFDAVTGPGYLQAIATNTSGCVTSTNFWITNAMATVTNDAVNLTFTIAGGSNGLAYDVFATAGLTDPITNGVWTWMGQGYQCVTYTIPGLTNGSVFLILGSPQDSDGDGLTDAYELLVSHTNPHNPHSGGDGILDGWKVLWGMNPTQNNPAQSGERANYIYDGTGRLESDTAPAFIQLFGFDQEGNIKSVQQ